MSEPGLHAFALAYQWWLTCDSYFAHAPLANELDGRWVRAIGKPYLVNRTIIANTEDAFARLILASGQDNGMDMERRAARLSHALGNSTFAAASAASKVSWFVWPRNWTMYDSYAAKAVIGTPGESGIARMERFFAALAMRGWSESLADVRDVVVRFGFDPMLAERSIDKHLFLHGVGAKPGGTHMAEIDGFVAALPADLRDRVRQTGKAVAAVLAENSLVHSRAKADRNSLLDRVENLRRYKEEIA